MKITLLTDGPSDNWLSGLIEWSCRSACGVRASVDWANPYVFRDDARRLHLRIEMAVEFYPCDILVVHRDSEACEPVSRQLEIADAVGVADVGVPVVPLVPARMSEAWLLSREEPICRAVGRRDNVALNLPTLAEATRMADPKARLDAALRIASGVRGRRLAQLNRDLPRYRRQVGLLTSDFSHLTGVPCFDDFQAAMCRAIADE